VEEESEVEERKKKKVEIGYRKWGVMIESERDFIYVEEREDIVQKRERSRVQVDESGQF